jgi:hypothetical protein
LPEKQVSNPRQTPNADASKGRGVLDSAVDFAVVGAAMDEADYRQSRICRLLGNPVVSTDRLARDGWLHDAEQTCQGGGSFGADCQRPSSQTQGGRRCSI